MYSFYHENQFHSYASKTNFHMKRFVFSLAFIMRFTATPKCPIHTTFFTVTNRCGRIGMLMGLCALYPQHLFILQSLVCLEVAGSWSNHYRYEPRELMSGAPMAAMFEILSSSPSHSINSPTCLSPHNSLYFKYGRMPNIKNDGFPV